MVDQCVKGEGLVQINAQVRTETRRINIVDVLKPTDEALAQLCGDSASDDASKKSPVTDDDLPLEQPAPIGATSDTATPSTGIVLKSEMAIAVSVPDSDLDETTMMSDGVPTPPLPPIKTDEPATKWIIDNNFKKDLARLRISEDPKEWTVAQVRHWLQWAVRQFNLTQIKLHDWNIAGKDLTNLTIEGRRDTAPESACGMYNKCFCFIEFQQKVPHDPEDLFWTHFELLRKCRMVAVRGQPSDDEEMDEYKQALSKKTPRTIVTKQVKQLKPSGKLCDDICADVCTHNQKFYSSSFLY